MHFARMSVPKLACEVSNASRFVWTMGGESDVSRKKHYETRDSTLFPSRRGI